MKVCTRCKEYKPLSDYYKDSRCRDGCRSECKSCVIKITKEYSQTERGRESHRKGSYTYERSEKGKAVKKRQYLRYPEARKARSVVNELVRNGIMPPAKSLQCNYCQKQAQQYHHHLGYAPEHWLDVVPACRLCDAKEHKRIA